LDNPLNVIDWQVAAVETGDTPNGAFTFSRNTTVQNPVVSSSTQGAGKWISWQIRRREVLNEIQGDGILPRYRDQIPRDRVPHRIAVCILVRAVGVEQRNQVAIGQPRVRKIARQLRCRRNRGQAGGRVPEGGLSAGVERFLGYLKSHGRLGDLAFVSLEHYPFEPCSITWKSLYREPYMMKHILDSLWAAGVPKEIPIMVTESHISWRLTGPMSTIFAALWLADNIGSFFEGGGAAFYHSPIQPQTVQDTCLGPASWSNFVADRDYNITGYTSPYWGARMINLEWVQHRSGVHQMFPSSTGIEDVTSYTVHRPDGNWSLMLVNRSETEPHAVRVTFDDAKGQHWFTGPVTMVTFGSEQYVWHAKGAESYAVPDGPPAAKVVSGGADATFMLPKASVTVLRGRVQ
jgi:hypothetical protein